MQCKKCEIDIPSQFEYVLSKNVCPKCGNKLMADAAMKVFIDLKTRLNEVEFVMDKATVCERVAMFLITNYEVIPMGTTTQVVSTVDSKIVTPAEVARFKAELAAIADADADMSPEEIRAEEAARAEELAIAREMGLDVSETLEDGEEAISGRTDNDRLQRLKKLAASNQITKTGSVGMIKRSSTP